MTLHIHCKDRTSQVISLGDRFAYKETKKGLVKMSFKEMIQKAQITARDITRSNFFSCYLQE